MDGASSEADPAKWGLAQSLLTKINALTNLRKHVRPLWHGVFKLDGSLEWILFSLQQLQHFRYRSVALTKRNVRTIVQLPVLNVDVRNPVVMLLDVLNRRNIVPRGEVSKLMPLYLENAIDRSQLVGPPKASGLVMLVCP